MIETEIRIKPTSAKVRAFLTNQVILLIFFALVIVSAVLSPKFLSAYNIFNLLKQQSPLFILSIGMLLAIITGGIDLSVGSQMSLLAVLLAVFIQKKGIPIATACMLVLLIGPTCGMLNGFLVEKVRINAFIATLATQSVFFGMSYIFSSGYPIYLDVPGIETFKLLGTGALWTIPVPVMIAAIFGVIFFLILKNCSYGRLMYATGGNREAVIYSGISTPKYIMSAYMVTGFLCAVSAILMTARLGMAHATVGEGMELDAIAAAIMGGAVFSGGKGSVFKMALGVLILGLIRNILNLLNVAAYPQLVFKGVIIIIAVAFTGMQEIRNRR